MYQESDFVRTKTAMTRFTVGYVILSVLVVAGAVVCLVMRSAVPLYLLAGLFTIASIFLWNIFGTRLSSYWRFLKEMREGRESVAQGVLAEMDEQSTTKDGVEFRALHLLVGDDTDKQGGRLLYADVSHLPLPVQTGQSVRVTLYGNFIKDIQPLEEK